MKKLFILTAAIGLFLVPRTSLAQGCEMLDAMHEGTTSKMVHYDNKDKVTGFTKTTVTEKKNIPGGESVSIHSVYDNTDDYTFESDMTMECRDGVTYIDMEKFIDPSSLEAYEEMEITVNADNISIPGNAGPGDELDGGKVTVTVNTGTPVNVTMMVEISNRKVLAEETVETPAGKYKCLKIGYDILSQVGFVKIRASSVEYYNKKVGVVRSESYNKKGKLTGYSVLEEYSN